MLLVMIIKCKRKYYVELLLSKSFFILSQVEKLSDCVLMWTLLLTFSVGPLTDLLRGVLDVCRHLLHGEDGRVAGRSDTGEPSQQVGELGRHGARLVAVKLRQRLGFEIAEHEEGVAPQQLHLQDAEEMQTSAPSQQHRGTAEGMTPTWWPRRYITKTKQKQNF